MVPRRYQDTEHRNSAAKARIARAAVQLLDGVMTAFFFSGSTVARVAEALGEEQRDQLTVVSPSLPVINTASSPARPMSQECGILCWAKCTAAR